MRKSTSTPKARGALPHSRQPRLAEPGLDLGGVGLTPGFGRLLRVDVLPGDLVGDRVLVGRRPVPLLDHVQRGRAALRELRAAQLLDDPLPVTAAVDAPVLAELRAIRVDAVLPARR